MKNIVLLSDGTGNGIAKIWKTNVGRIYHALDLSDGTQVAYYDDGVGSSSYKWLALIGGVFGYGLKRNVFDLYKFLCRNYEKGDRIYAFGFSRGAFTILMLLQIVSRIGLVSFDSELELSRNVKGVYRDYRRCTSTNWLSNFVVVFLRTLRDLVITIWYRVRGFEPYSEVGMIQVPSIHFVGLWDTVGAYGLPIEWLNAGLDLWIWPMWSIDSDLSVKVRRACHALSLDDDRRTFHPILLSEHREQRVFPGTVANGKSSRRISNVKDERVSQIWFSGAHADVGGGYPDDSLAHVSLRRIMDEARQLGIRYKRGAQQALFSAAVLRGPIHNSRSGIGFYYRYSPRRIELLCHDTIDPEVEVHIEWPKIHATVFQRIGSGTDRYAPIGLPARYAVVMENGDIRVGPYPGISIPLAANPYEHGTQSISRARLQEKVWNLVWWRQLFYFAALCSTGSLLFFPYFFGRDIDPAHKQPEFLAELAACSGRHFVETLGRHVAPNFAPVVDPLIAYVINPLLSFLSAMISTAGLILSPTIVIIEPTVREFTRVAREVMPGAGTFEPWLAAYEAHPGWFVLGAITVSAFIFLESNFARIRLVSRMRFIWEPIVDAGPRRITLVPPPKGFIYKLRTSDLHRYNREFIRWYLLPTAAAWIYFYFIAVLSSCAISRLL